MQDEVVIQVLLLLSPIPVVIQTQAHTGTRSAFFRRLFRVAIDMKLLQSRVQVKAAGTTRSFVKSEAYPLQNTAEDNGLNIRLVA